MVMTMRTGEGQERGFRDLQVDQPHLSPLDIYRSNPKVISKHMQDKRMVQNSQYGFTKVKCCLTPVTRQMVLWMRHAT